QPPPRPPPATGEPQLHEDLAVSLEPALELVDLVVGGGPDPLLHELLDPLDQHPAVPGVVEESDLAVLRQPDLVAPQPVVALIQLGGRRAGVGAEGARVQALDQPPDGRHLAGGVTSLADIEGG